MIPLMDLVRLILCAVVGFFHSKASLEAEVLALRHQLNVLKRKSPRRLTFNNFDRLIFSCLYHFSPSILKALTVIQPETVIRWHRLGFRLFWRWKSRSRVGRPKVPLEIRQLIRTMSLAIHCGALLGSTANFSSLRSILARPPLRSTWRRVGRRHLRAGGRSYEITSTCCND
jgi:hypothetical protein